METENEIDVLAMHGMIPVFISCKNGYVDIDELYKLNTVAQQFGSGYAKKVLIASSLNKETGFGDDLADRAEAMGIRVLANETSSCTVDELAEKLKYLWK